MSTKLQQLANDWGYDEPEQMAEDCLLDGVCPAICMTPGCDYSTEMEPDQEHGWCECCGTNSMKSGMILMGII